MLEKMKNRFESRFIKSDSGCWEWKSNFTHNGYGQFHVTGDGKRRAHRVAYEMYVGPIPDGLVVMHMCDNRKCVNPEHLMLGTQKDNITDASAKGRLSGCRDAPRFSPVAGKIGSENIRAKLSDIDVQDIRWLATLGVKWKKLSQEFGVHYRNIQAIVIRRSWQHI